MHPGFLFRGEEVAKGFFQGFIKSMHVFFFYSFLQARKTFQKKIHPITSVMRWKAPPWTIFTFENSRLYMIF